MNVSGSISQILKGLNSDVMPIESLIGLPINDSNGKQIGAITSISIDNDLWHGNIIYDILEENKVTMEINRASKYREELIQQVKLLGQEVIDRAENLVGNNDLRSGFEIRLIFNQESSPFVECTTRHLSKRLIDSFNDKIPSSVAQSGILLSNKDEGQGGHVFCKNNFSDMENKATVGENND